MYIKIWINKIKKISLIYKNKNIVREIKIPLKITEI